MIRRIYLHWTAGRYDQLFRDYHICIDGDGKVYKMADFEQKLAHTYLRNSNAVGIALCCCYGASVACASEQRTVNSEQLRKDGLENYNSVSGTDNHNCSLLSVTCSLTNGPWTINWGSYPPTPPQIQSMARCVARLCKMYGLPVDKETVMTHAEVAELDGYGIYSHDPEMKWDLLRLPGYGGQSGGEVIRELARKML